MAGYVYYDKLDQLTEEGRAKNSKSKQKCKRLVWSELNTGLQLYEQGQEVVRKPHLEKTKKQIEEYRKELKAWNDKLP